MKNTIGHSVTRIDARDKVTGTALYSGDLVRPDMLFMKTLFAGRPHARVVRIDTAQALALPGVVAVFTAADVPVNEYGLQWKDQPVLCGPSTLPEKAETGVKADWTSIVRFEGDQVAAIVAETEAIAAKARNLVQVEYEDLPAVFDPTTALKPEAPRIHTERGDSNICVWDKIARAMWMLPLPGRMSSSKANTILLTRNMPTCSRRPGWAYFDEKGRITIECAGQWDDCRSGNRLPTLLACRTNRCASSIRPLVALLAGAKTYPCKSSWRWRS